MLQTTSLEALAFEVRNFFELAHPKTIIHPDECDEKYLMHAAELGHLGVYQLMAEKFEDKNPREYWYHPTPLHRAAARGHLSICQYIIKHTKNKNPTSNIENRDGVTPLHLAARSGHLEVCRIIVKHAEVKNPKSSDGYTPLELAENHGHFEICELITSEMGE